MQFSFQCLKCQHQFFKPAKSNDSVPVLQCPKCRSKMVIELNIRQFDHSSTKESLTSSLPGKDGLETKRHSVHRYEIDPCVRNILSWNNFPSSADSRRASGQACPGTVFLGPSLHDLSCLPWT